MAAGKQEAGIAHERQVVATQKERGEQRAHDRDLNELGDHKEAHLHGAVFGVVAGHQLRLRLRQVERDPLVLGDRGREKQKRREGLHEHAPLRQHAQHHARLLTHDRAQVDGAVHENQAHDGEGHDQLVRNHLRAGPQSTQERELVARAPAGQHGADDRESAKGEHDQDARVELRDLQRVGAATEPRGQRRKQLRGIERAAERDHGEHQQHWRDYDERRQEVAQRIVRLRREVLLEEHLQAVGHAMEQSQPHQLDVGERDLDVGAVGADPVRHYGGLLALHPGEQPAEAE